MRDLRVVDAVFFRLFVEKVEQIFDGERQDLAAMRRREDRLEQVVDELLQSSLRGKKTRQVDFGDHLRRAIDGVGHRIGAASMTAAAVRPIFALPRDICVGEKVLDPSKERERQTDRETDRQIERQIDR